FDAGIELWDEADEFYYDVLHCPSGELVPIKLHSIVGLIPLFAVETLEPEILDKLPDFKRRVEWFLNYRPDLAGLISHWHEQGQGERRLLSLLRGHRMKMLLKRMLDETEFLSDYGVRSLSKFHQDNPYRFHANGMEFSVAYQPAESDSGLFGGNSNWRGPVWFPINYLIIESLQKFHHYYGDDFKIEHPTGSGHFVTIAQAANELSQRLTRIFLKDENGKRPVFGNNETIQTDPHFRDYVLFHEYFHGDNGRGVGASHQTGWTGLVAKLLQPQR
ncbi:MAG: glucosidase, partial [bacterium]|nr:glucosidase [bacterium]